MLDRTKISYEDEDGYTWHYYKCYLNDRGYISSFESVDDNPQEADIFEAGARFSPELNKGCYKIVNNQVVYDDDEYQRILAKEEEERRKPTQLDKVESQSFYTAMMTDTLLDE